MNAKVVFWLALLGVAGAYLYYSASRGTSFGTGQPAQEIEGQDVDGRPMKLSDFRGQVVLLDFWGNW